MVGRRLLILVAVLMGLMVLAASVAPPPETPRQAAGGNPTPSSAAGAGPAATPTAIAARPGDTSPTATLDVARGRDHVAVHAGTALTLQVVSRATGSVEIVGMSVVAAVDPSTPARFALSADAPGHFPVRLVEGGKPLGELVVTR